MKSIHPRSLAKVRALTSRYDNTPKCLNFRFRASSTVVSRPNQRSFSRSVRASEWTQHNVSEFNAFPTTPAKLPDNHLEKAYIALGSNLGSRLDWIERACSEMERQGIKILRTSCLWETDPMYVLEQDKFVNGVCEVETTLSPIELLDTLQGIENHLGRKKEIDKGPRNIDLDILLYGQNIIDHERLKIPHPLMFEREFVLRPLAEIIPAQSLHPSSPWKTTIDYLNALPPSPSPMTTLTPLKFSQDPIRALSPSRKTLIMAIMNFTPDSFSNDGVNTPNKDLELSSLHHTAKVTAQHGAHIIDVGGQSSTPGALDITADEEISRTVPAIEVLRSTEEFKSAISIDTYRAEVAEAAVNAGADIINDISAGQLDKDMLSTMARLGKTVCLMHMRGTPQTMQRKKYTNYEPRGLIPTIAEELLERVAEAEAAGIRRWRIILDPGIGFAKTSEHALEILRRMDELRDWPGLRGLPWLVGSSRKGFIGKITNCHTPHQRIEGTAATVAAAIHGGADIVRVHDVEQMARVALMSDAIWRV